MQGAVVVMDCAGIALSITWSTGVSRNETSIAAYFVQIPIDPGSLP